MSGEDARRAVAIGGGTGLPAVLTCLVEAGFQTTAVVTMADDGGSSGVLRAELGMLPPGDIRNCLAALAEPDNPLATLFQHRFASGEGLAGHALGNLIIAALSEISGSFPDAIEQAAVLLGARGTVLPSTLEDILLRATDSAGNPLTGQARIAVSEHPVDRVCLEPERPAAYPPVLDALRAADVVIVGPGSLYTSILPNFLVDGVVDTLRDSAATRIYVCNVANQRGETGGMDAADHVDALLDHGLKGAIDVVVVHVSERAGGDVRYDSREATPVEPVDAGPDVVARIRQRGVRVVTADVLDPNDPRHHSRELLCGVLRKVVS